jgi:hypothetical protein
MQVQPRFAQIFPCFDAESDVPWRRRQLDPGAVEEDRTVMMISLAQAQKQMLFL